MEHSTSNLLLQDLSHAMRQKRFKISTETRWQTIFGSGVLEHATSRLPWSKCICHGQNVFHDFFMVLIRHTAIWMKRRCLPFHNASKGHEFRSRPLFHCVLLINLKNTSIVSVWRGACYTSVTQHVSMEP